MSSLDSLRSVLPPPLCWLWMTTPDEFERKLLARTSLLQYLTFQFFAISVLLAMPVQVPADQPIARGDTVRFLPYGELLF